MKAQSKSFANIDNNRLATAKQFFRVTVHYANLVKDEKGIPEKFFFRLRKQVEAVLARHNPEGLTHGDVQECLASKKLPTYLIGNLQLVPLVGTKKAAPKKQPKAKKQPQAVSKPKPVEQPQVVNVVRDKPKVDTFAAVDARLTFLEEEVSIMSEDIQTIKSGMEMILESIRG